MALYYENQVQKQEAEKYIQNLAASKKIEPIQVDVLPTGPFYPAEEYH